MQTFVDKNYGYAAALLRSTKFTQSNGPINSVHFAIGWNYKGRSHPELVNQPVLAVAFDRYKQQWDFPGGRNASKALDPVVQFLETAYKELYEELAVIITAPLESFVLEIIRCGANGRSFLVVCGIKGLVAHNFRAVMHHRQSIRPRLDTRFLEMSDFAYLGAGDKNLLTHSTGYVKGHHARALNIVKNHSGFFPAFDSVMRIKAHM